MKKVLLLLFINLPLITVFAQDSTVIIYTQETDSLVKQRFIDRYENVFMTKVPTRHMIKLGVAREPFIGGFESAQIFDLAHEVGYEYKLTPALSIGVNASLNSSFSIRPFFAGTVSANAYGRWYYDMKRRIAEGKSANNFSGNYLSVVIEKRWKYVPFLLPVSRVGVEFGIQRRFFNHGRLEFGVGVFYQKYTGQKTEGNEFVKAAQNALDLSLSTRSNLGLAFGDWKRTHNIAACEILNCDDAVSRQFKILLPSLNIGTRLIQGMVGVGYEVKMGKSPLSLSAQIVADYLKTKPGFLTTYSEYLQKTYQLQPSLQLRYYYLQRRKIRTGKGGNNLSGIYVGPHLEYISSGTNGYGHPTSNQHLGIGLTYGYQKTLFGNVYIDVNGAMSWAIFDDRSSRTTVRIGFGLSL